MLLENYKKLKNAKAKREAEQRRRTRLSLLLGGLLAAAGGAHVKHKANANAARANWLKSLKPHPGGLVLNNGKWTNSTSIYTAGNNRPFIVKGNNVYSLKSTGFDPHAWAPTFKVGNLKTKF